MFQDILLAHQGRETRLAEQSSFPSSTNVIQQSRDGQVKCQICLKKGHTAIVYYNRHNEQCFLTTIQEKYQNRNCYKTKLASLANMIWYLDLGASNHVTTSIDNIQEEDKASSGRSVAITNGKHLAVTNNGHSILNSQSKSLLLTEILCVPEVEKNLMSIYKVCKDNNVRFIFINLTDHGSANINSVVKASLTLWHHRFGH